MHSVYTLYTVISTCLMYMKLHVAVIILISAPLHYCLTVYKLKEKPEQKSGETYQMQMLPYR